MKTPRTVMFAFAAAVCSGSVTAAQESAPTPKPAAPAAVPRPERAASLPARTRAVSSQMAAQLMAVAPKYDPAPVVKPTEAAPDLRSADESRNTIVRLPNFIVREEKHAAPTEREMLTPKGRLELALKKHPGVLHTSLPIFSLLNSEGIALVMLAEEERLERKREFEDMANLTRFSDPAAAEKTKREVEQAFMRRRDFGR